MEASSQVSAGENNEQFRSTHLGARFVACSFARPVRRAALTSICRRRRRRCWRPIASHLCAPDASPRRASSRSVAAINKSAEFGAAADRDLNFFAQEPRGRRAAARCAGKCWPACSAGLAASICSAARRRLAGQTGSERRVARPGNSIAPLSAQINFVVPLALLPATQPVWRRAKIRRRVESIEY